MIHRRTFLKIPKTNGGALTGAVLTALLVGILQLTQRQLAEGTLPIPPGVQPYLPFLVGVLGLIVTAIVNAGTPHYAPDDKPGGR